MVDKRNPVPVLSGARLQFFYGILTLWESNARNKVINDFRSKEVNKFLSRTDSNGLKILSLSTDKKKTNLNCRYRIYLLDTKSNLGLSLLYHLRNAFAHNDIKLVKYNKKTCISIHHVWKGTTRLETIVPFKVLKELIDIIRGIHDGIL